MRALKAAFGAGLLAYSFFALQGCGGILGSGSPSEPSGDGGSSHENTSGAGASSGSSASGGPAASSGGSGGAQGGASASGASNSSGQGGARSGAIGSSGASGGNLGDGGGSSGASSGSVSVGPPGACLEGITDYQDAGPFKYTAAASGRVKLWVPTVSAGCKVPMVHLANATGATCSDYADAIDRLASHGFLTLCYEDPSTGGGALGLTAFETALSMYPDLADKRLGSAGHAEGGQAAFVTLQFAEAKWGATMLYAGLAMEPESGGTQPDGDAGTWQEVYGEIHSPMFMFSGTADMLVSEAWVGQAYGSMSSKDEAYWWSATGAVHIPTPQVPMEQVSIPWFRWKLLGDQAACRYFKAMPGNPMVSPGWTKKMSENEAPCL